MSVVSSEDDQAILDKTLAAQAAWRATRAKVFDLSREMKTKQALETYNGSLLPLFKEYSAGVAALSDRQKKNADLVGNASKATGTLATRLVIGGLAIAAFLGGALAYFITRSVNRGLKSIAATLATGSELTTSAATQVSASSQSLAQGASEQAASLEETSSALNEMASMVKKNSDTSQQANALSEEAKRAADSGTQAMGKMSTAIADIERSSQETAKIVKTIDEIAFQTNLLALNAAVEAARAGEAGKGFAVVAEEVRNLAMRSAEAAKNTSCLIEESVSKAKNGVSMASTVAASLHSINETATRVSGLIAEIAAASREQATGIDQINQAVGQMDKVTQTNAANAEETAAASEELNAQAEQLSGCVRQLQQLVGISIEAKPITVNAGMRIATQKVEGSTSSHSLAA